MAKAEVAMIVRGFNREYPIGTPVTVRRDNDEIMTTRTRSQAYQLPSGVAVIMVEGISGCYSLIRVTPIDEQSQ